MHEHLSDLDDIVNVVQTKPQSDSYLDWICASLLDIFCTETSSIHTEPAANTSCLAGGPIWRLKLTPSFQTLFGTSKVIRV